MGTVRRLQNILSEKEPNMSDPKNQAASRLTACAHLIAAGGAVHWLHPFDKLTQKDGKAVRRGKSPVDQGWQQAPRYTAAELAAAPHDPNANIGLRLGEPSEIDGMFLHVIDLDVKPEADVDAIHAKLTELWPDWRTFPRVISGSGGDSRHIYFLTDRHFGKHRLASGPWGEIALMGTGSQVVLPPSLHPITGQPYRWEKPLELDLQDLMTEDSALVASWCGADDRKPERGGAARCDWETEAPKIERALAALPDSVVKERDGDRVNGCWLYVGMALHHASEGRDEGLALWNDWSARSAKFNAKENAYQWRRFGRSGDGWTHRSLYAWAAPYGFEELEITGDDFDDMPPDLPEAASGAWAIDPLAVDSEPDLSHDALAVDLGRAKFDADARFCGPLGGWLLWDGSRWVVDEQRRHMTLIRYFVRKYGERLMEWAKARAPGMTDAEAEKFLAKMRATATALRQAPFIANVETLAKSNPRSASRVDQWDCEDLLLGTPAGTVDLRTGQLRPSRREDYISRSTACGPAPEGTRPERWLRFLNECFPDDPEMPEFLQRLAGYALTGLTREHRLFFFQGTGRNGKGTFLNTLQPIWGDYARGLPPSALLESRNPQHMAPLAALRGARMARAAEIQGGQTWNDAIVKQLTGGDTITANRMRCDPFDFTPKLTLFVDANKLPRIRGADPAMAARMTLIPWRQHFPKGTADEHLGAALKAEAPAILRWAIDGARAYLRDGLTIPEAVKSASLAYMENEDTIGQFLTTRTEPLRGARLTRDTLYTDYLAWCDKEHADPMTHRAFAQVMRERGLREVKSHGTYHWSGLILRERTAFDDDLLTLD